jgi:alpha-galactosidase
MQRTTKPKIAIIGAASTSFCTLLQELVMAPDLDGSELALVDIDKPGLDVIIALGRRMAKEWGKKTKVTGSTNRRKALEGADFVITTIAVGGVKTWRQDEEIPAKHGFFGHSVDTVGPGGLFRGLRLIPPLIAICRDIEELCPDAWVINYSNPMSAICRAMHKATKVKAVGLCTASYLPGQIANAMGVDEERVDVISAGVNHCVWALKVFVDGKDVTEEHRNVMRKKLHVGMYAYSSLELMEIFGAWPMPGANHVAEFFPYFYGDLRDGRSLRRYPFREGHDFDERLRDDKAMRAKFKAQGEGKVKLGHKAHETGDLAIKLLTSIWYNKRTRLYANVRNGGAVSNLPDHAVVEVPVVCDSAGIKVVQAAPLPDALAGLVQARVAFFEMLADAAIHKSKDIALQCLMADTNTTSISRAKACLKEMFKVQAQFLPGYK